MKYLVTGSAGHLGEALVRALKARGDEVVSIDINPSAHTSHVGSIVERNFVHECMKGVDVVFHAATLHKPHVATHTRQQFIDTNVTGTLNVLEEAVSAGVKAFIFTSTTSVFGDAMRPGAHEPAVWVTEDVVPQPKNIYGATKAAAEDLCQLFARNQKLPCMVLRTSRFFPEADDNKNVRDAFDDENTKANEYLYRRGSLEDMVSAHFCAAEKAAEIGFGKYIISATTPFTKADLGELRHNASAVLQRYIPAYEAIYAARGWKMFDSIGRVYVNEKARRELGWQPQHDFAAILKRVNAGEPVRTPLSQQIGSKGYHETVFENEPFPVEAH